MLNVGLLGAGRIAGVHAAAITTNPGSRLVAVSDINTEAAGQAGQAIWGRGPGDRRDPGDPKIDAVLIATSTDTHSDLIERATGAGRGGSLRKAGRPVAKPVPGPAGRSRPRTASR